MVAVPAVVMGPTAPLAGRAVLAGGWGGDVDVEAVPAGYRGPGAKTRGGSGPPLEVEGKAPVGNFRGLVSGSIETYFLQVNTHYSICSNSMLR